MTNICFILILVIYLPEVLVTEVHERWMAGALRTLAHRKNEMLEEVRGQDESHFHNHSLIHRQKHTEQRHLAAHFPTTHKTEESCQNCCNGYFLGLGYSFSIVKFPF